MKTVLLGAASLVACSVVSIVDAAATAAAPFTALAPTPDPMPVLAMGLLLLGAGALMRNR